MVIVIVQQHVPVEVSKLVAKDFLLLAIRKRTDKLRQLETNSLSQSVTSSDCDVLIILVE
jgi:hypothetical protein